MPAIEFTEIAEAQAGPNRDQFELFAREFLEQEGFRVISGPDRGADGGRDLILEEVRQGPGGETRIRWLVSCKHKAHSGKSVTPNDETNIRDRIETHNCTGFVAFYSTLPSSGLRDILESLQLKFEFLIYDREKIEQKLLYSPRGRQLAERFTPMSFHKWAALSQYVTAALPSNAQSDKGNFFLRPPQSELLAALSEASEQKSLVFVVVFDPAHPKHSKLSFALGYFMVYHTTKRLVDKHFVVVVGPSSDPQLSALVPEDDPLELCLWVVLDSTGKLLRRESVYANPDEGMKRVREVIENFSG